MWKDYLKALSACLLWSTAFVGVKVGLQYTTPLFFAGIRFILAGILVLILSRNIRGLIPYLREHWKLAVAVGSLQTGIMYGLFFNGINLLPAGIAAIITGTSPLITSVTAHFTIADDKLTPRKILGFIIAITGVVLISIGRNASMTAWHTELIGILLLLTSSSANAFSQVIVKKHPSNPLLLNASQIFIGGCMLLITSLVVEGVPTLSFPPIFYGTLLWLSAVSGFAFSIWFTLLQKPTVKISELNIFKFVIPVTGAILSWVIIPNDNPNLLSIMGMCIIASSIILFYGNKAKKEIPVTQI